MQTNQEQTNESPYRSDLYIITARTNLHVGSGDEAYGEYYMPGVSDVEWVPQSAPSTIDSLPTPGPAPSST